MNIPLPPQTTGDVYLAAFDQLIVPMSEKFAPTWLIVSAGFDAHRNDPITDMGLSSADYPLMMQRILQLVPAGRRLVMLEGGYDLDALRMSTASTLAAMVGESHSDERPTSGGPAESMKQLAVIEAHWK
jgi:acetoin utilization deacetylase AcuC-like enzyme